MKGFRQATETKRAERGELTFSKKQAKKMRAQALERMGLKRVALRAK